MRKESNKKDDNKSTLKDRLDQDILSKLSSKKESMRKQQKEMEEQDRQKKLAERKRKEENISFEELFFESDMDWKKYK
ncbi:YqkE family protein [Aquibacillus rhizosphaerae]|uniref:YqkE family protein n=1 Tax=Aquibacillus rhizosphaerae TaxID=3051431 RepID=A0ABT7L685_9BACI|nr:YqkE family protein [Aquibacillus sp. LR5S19]MDL4840727.1 YqkE family protein [Aquibacillus sp. LR5S19]